MTSQLYIRCVTSSGGRKKKGGERTENIHGETDVFLMQTHHFLLLLSKSF